MNHSPNMKNIKNQGRTLQPAVKGSLRARNQGCHNLRYEQVMGRQGKGRMKKHLVFVH